MASIPCAAYYASSQIRARQNRSRHCSGNSMDSIPDTTVNVMPNTASLPGSPKQDKKTGQFSFNPMSYIKTGPWLNPTALPAAGTSLLFIFTGVTGIKADVLVGTNLNTE